MGEGITDDAILKKLKRVAEGYVKIKTDPAYTNDENKSLDKCLELYKLTQEVEGGAEVVKCKAEVNAFLSSYKNTQFSGNAKKFYNEASTLYTQLKWNAFWSSNPKKQLELCKKIKESIQEFKVSQNLLQGPAQAERLDSSGSGTTGSASSTTISQQAGEHPQIPGWSAPYQARTGIDRRYEWLCKKDNMTAHWVKYIGANGQASYFWSTKVIKDSKATYWRYIYKNGKWGWETYTPANYPNSGMSNTTAKPTYWSGIEVKTRNISNGSTRLSNVTMYKSRYKPAWWNSTVDAWWIPPSSDGSTYGFWTVYYNYKYYYQPDGHSTWTVNPAAQTSIYSNLASLVNRHGSNLTQISRPQHAPYGIPAK